MDHKEFYERYGQDLVSHNYSVTNEEFFEIIKQRLAEEFKMDQRVVISGQDYAAQSAHLDSLIDTTKGGENGR